VASHTGSGRPCRPRSSVRQAVVVRRILAVWHADRMHACASLSLSLSVRVCVNVRSRPQSTFEFFAPSASNEAGAKVTTRDLTHACERTLESVSPSIRPSTLIELNSFRLLIEPSCSRVTVKRQERFHTMQIVCASLYDDVCAASDAHFACPW